MIRPQIHGIFDAGTSTITYIVYEGPGSACAIVDSVLDYDPKAGRTATTSADNAIAFVEANQLKVEWLLETHAHADHLSAAPYLQQRLGGKIGIGASICTVQKAFGGILNSHAPRDGSQFDHLFAADEIFKIGNMEAQAMHVPGHTPADIAYHIGDAVLLGDTMFMPDVGTARCDFPGGSASTLYQSIQRILALPPETRLFTCHDYPPSGREAAWETTVAAQRASNIHVREGTSEKQFVEMRTMRDATLAMPVLILPAIQVNIAAGHLPEAEENGVRYLRIPLNAI